MKPAGAEPCAQILQRDDPHLYATALFAPEPARSRLIVLYAFDVELSRAAQISTESLIPRMRLQWWRDTAEAARAGAPAPAHEVAGPFNALIREHGLPEEPVEALITAREAELAGGFDAPAFACWTDKRFGALTELAVRLLAPDEAETVALARRTGWVLGAAFALRNAAAMAPKGDFLLPGLSPVDRAAFSAGEVTVGTHAAVRRIAGEALRRLASLRERRGSISRAASPAFLPLVRAARVLRRAERLPQPADDGRSPRSPDTAAIALARLGHERPFDGFALALRAGSGRW